MSEARWKDVIRKGYTEIVQETGLEGVDVPETLIARLEKVFDADEVGGVAEPARGSATTEVGSVTVPGGRQIEVGLIHAEGKPPHSYYASGTKILISPSVRLVRIEASDGTLGEERYALNYTEFDHLIGRLLTIMDASFSDPEQRKAMKDIVKQTIKDWIGDNGEMAWADADQHSFAVPVHAQG